MRLYMKTKREFKIIRETREAIEAIPHYIKNVNRAIDEAKNYEHAHVDFEMLDWSTTPTTPFTNVIEPVLLHYLTACGYKAYISESTLIVTDDDPYTPEEEYPVPNGTYYFRSLEIFWTNPITGQKPFLPLEYQTYTQES